jgi:hypothetical protein
MREGGRGIDDYLFELRHLLRIPADRIVVDVEEQLHELAERHGEAAAIAQFGSPEGVARRFHIQARRRAVLWAMRMLVVTGVTLLVTSIAVDVLYPAATGPRRMSLSLQWTLTLSGMFALTAAALGLTAVWSRARDDYGAAIRCALAALLAAVPAVALHLTFQIDKLAHAHHDKWFTALFAVSAGVRIGLVAAAVVVTAQASRTFRAADAPALRRTVAGAGVVRRAAA